MIKNKNKTWLLIFTATTSLTLLVIIFITAYIDPYMHFHKPLTDRFYYKLNNQRSQNIGILKHFDYDSIITGTSMTENFKTTEMDKIFGTHSIKVPYSGASFNEINNSLKIAFKNKTKIKYVIRGLDQSKFIEEKDYVRTDLGNYPTYLYDNNPFNDIEYLLNRDVLYNRIWNMIKQKQNLNKVGITSFDNYSNWMDKFSFGKTAVLEKYFKNKNDKYDNKKQIYSLTEYEKQIIKENVEQNITNLADQNPNTKFYYFLTPYSAAYWGKIKQNGMLKKHIETLKYAIPIIISHKNIYLFGWNRFDLFDNLNNYKDGLHYGEWINSWILSQMKKESGRIDIDNYNDFIDKFHDHYMNYNYNSLFEQIDNEADYYISGLLNKEISGTEPLIINNNALNESKIKNAKIILYPDENKNLSSISSNNYCSFKFDIDISNYRTLNFLGKNNDNQDYPIVYIYDEYNNLIKKINDNYKNTDNNWHQYAINISDIYGKTTIIIDGGCFYQSKNTKSKFIFKNIILY